MDFLDVAFLPSRASFYTTLLENVVLPHVLKMWCYNISYKCGSTTYLINVALQHVLQNVVLPHVFINVVLPYVLKCGVITCL